MLWFCFSTRNPQHNYNYMTYRELKKSHIHLIKGKKGMQEKLLGLDEKCQNMMLLKFGREVSEIFLNHF